MSAGLDEVRRGNRRPPEQGRRQESLPHRRRRLLRQEGVRKVPRIAAAEHAPGQSVLLGQFLKFI